MLETIGYHSISIHVFITILLFTCPSFAGQPGSGLLGGRAACTGRGDDTVGSPHRAQICQFELFELIFLLKLDKHFPVEQFEATVSQSTVPSHPLSEVRRLSQDPCNLRNLLPHPGGAGSAEVCQGEPRVYRQLSNTCFKSGE